MNRGRGTGRVALSITGTKAATAARRCSAHHHAATGGSATGMMRVNRVRMQCAWQHAMHCEHTRTMEGVVLCLKRQATPHNRLVQKWHDAQGHGGVRVSSLHMSARSSSACVCGRAPRKCAQQRHGKSVPSSVTRVHSTAWPSAHGKSARVAAGACVAVLGTDISASHAPCPSCPGVLAAAHRQQRTHCRCWVAQRPTHTRTRLCARSLNQCTLNKHHTQ